MQALFLTLLVSFIFCLGMFIPKFVKNKDKLLLVSTSLTFIIMLFLIIFDLIPEILEILNPSDNPFNLLYILGCVGLGILFLKVLDMFIPEHTHIHHKNEKNIKKHNEHLFHIGLITSLSLIIHNFLEGISIYVTGINDYKLGLLMALSVGLHNLPLGIEVSISLNASDKKVSRIIITILLIFSSFIGALILNTFNIVFNELMEGILLSITLGMVFYLAFFELLNEIKQNKGERETKIGILIGVILSIILFNF